MVLSGRRHREEEGSSKSGEVRCARALRCCCGLEEKTEEELLSCGLERGKEEDLVGIGMAGKNEGGIFGLGEILRWEIVRRRWQGQIP